MFRFRKWIFALIAAKMLAPTWVESAPLTDDTSFINEVAWRVSLAPDSLTAGSSTVLSLTATVPPGWYMYAPDSPAGRPLHVELDRLDSIVSGEMNALLGPVEGYDENFDSIVRYFEGEAEFQIDLDVAQSAVGDVVVSGLIDYMICSDRICIPRSEPFSVVLHVVAPDDPIPAIAQNTPPAESDIAESPPPATQEQPDEAAPPDESAPPESAPNPAGTQSRGLWGFLLLAAGAGLAAIFTPCVFPMIPLTVSFFSHHSSNRSQAVRIALVYGLAIVLTFTGLGILMAVLVGAAGPQTIAANPWINLFIGAIFILFALSLLGLFELRLPNSLVNYFNRQGNERRGMLGVLFMGLTLTLVSFSCTAPFVGGLLAATTMNQWTWPIIGMVVFSATFAIPFVLFAMFPNWLSSLPKSGSWMNAVKVTLGFVELAAALKFLSNADLVWGWNLLSRTLVIALWIVIFFLAGMYLLGKLDLVHNETPGQIGTIRLLFAIGFLGLSFYMIPGLLGSPLNAIDAWLPPRKVTDVSLLSSLAVRSDGTAAGAELEWYGNDSSTGEEAIQNALEEGERTMKPIFVDFTGYTCTNCRQMEANVFPDDRIRRLLEDEFVLLRLYTDASEDGPVLQKYQLRLTGTVALPTYAIVSTSGKLLSKWEGMATIDEFEAFLRSAVQLFSAV